MADDVLVFNHHQANLNVRTSTSATGATRSRSYITTTVHSEPIVAMLDEGAVAKRAAEMLAQRIREQTERITDTVKASTAKARRAAERAFARGEAWAVKRYAGGRTGATPPRPGEDRAFNHSGRLARSIVANFSKQSKEWFIRYAANRWRVEDFSSPAAMERAFMQWVARVPVLQDASSDLGIQRAIRETAGELLQKQGMDAGYKAAQARGKRAVEALKTISQPLSDTSMTAEDEEGAA